MREKIRLYCYICRAEFRAFYHHRKIPFLICFILAAKTGCACYSLLETNKLFRQYQLSGINDFATEILIDSLRFYFYFCRILPILFYFLALYCVMTMRRRGWDEAAAVSCTKTGRASRYGFMLLIIGCCVLLSSLLMYVVFLGAALPDWQLRTFFLGDMARLVALYDFFPTLFWMLAGALTGFAGGWNIAAAVSVGAFFVFNGPFISIMQNVSEVTEIFYRIGNLLCLYIQLLVGDCYHMFPMGNGCFARVLFWIFLTIALLCMAVRKRPQRAAVPMVLAFICLAYYLLPDGMPVYAEHDFMQHSSSQYDARYYSGGETIEIPADFGVESYVMDLEIGRQLRAEVAVRLTESGGQQEAYRFTLYHRCHISSITDQDGQEMDYERDGDFITVYGGESVEEIRFVYAGSGKMFYTTEYALYLPSFFPYYPVPGHYMIGDNYDYNALRTEAYYTVRVAADIPVECSLPSATDSGDGDNGVRVFEGYCFGPALVGSKYLQNYMTPEGIKIIYSGMEFTESEVASICKTRGLTLQEYGSSIIASVYFATGLQISMYSDGYYSLIYKLRFDIFESMMEKWAENPDKIKLTNSFR